jgi:hypothetical protein
MPFNLLILPLLGGFILFSHWNRSKFFAKRQDKERLLLYSSLYGAILLGISFVASVLLPFNSWLLALRTWWAYHTPALQYSGISTFAFGLGLLGCCALNYVWPFNRIWKPTKQAAKALQDFGGPLEQLLYKALEDRKRVMITLSNGKVYIGRVTKSLAPGDDTAFYLLPTKSGYREPDKHRLVITTHYDLAYAKIAQNEPDGFEIISDFGVVIPVKEVVSATLYREDIHAKYFPHVEPEKPLAPAATNPPKPLAP